MEASRNGAMPSRDRVRTYFLENFWRPIASSYLSVTVITDSLSVRPYSLEDALKAASRAGVRMWEASHIRSRRAAGLIDCHIHQDCRRTFSSDQHPRRISLSAIGRCLKHQYDAAAPPIPPRLDALIEKISHTLSSTLRKKNNSRFEQPTTTPNRPQACHSSRSY